MTSHCEIVSVVDDYFAGIYSGNVERLRSAFHATAVLWGEVRGQPYYKKLDDYLNAVGNRKSPEALGEAFAMKLLSIEVWGTMAFVKARCPMLGFDYLDFLSLLYQDGRWAIVAKTFTEPSMM
jgi:hypothetical protein